MCDGNREPTFSKHYPGAGYSYMVRSDGTGSQIIDCTEKGKL